MNHDLFRFPAGQHLRTIGAVLLGCLGLVQLGHAAGVSVAAQDSAFARFMSTTVGAGQETVSFSSTGTPVLTPSSANLQVESGVVNATRTGGIRMPSGQALPVTAKAQVTGATMAPMFKKALGLVPALYVGVALYDVAKELGYKLTKNPDGSVTVQKQSEGNWTSGTAPTCNTLATGSWVIDSAGYKWGVRETQLNWAGYSNVQTCTNYPLQGGGYYWGLYKSNSVVSPTYTASSDTAFADAVAAKTGWPDSSAVAKALDQAQRVTGDPVPTNGPKVSGPASLVGPKETTTNPITNGTRETTKQTNYDCTYSDGATVMDGGIVTCTERVVTTQKDTVTDPQTQQTSTTTTTTGTTTKPADTTAQKPQESTDPCDKNPDRVGCSTLDIPAEPIPSTSKSITYTPEVLFGNGVCPANKVVVSHGLTLTVWDWQQTCTYTTNYVRPIVLIICAFVAMMILVPRSE